jgi:hypothetical protein
VFSKILLKKFQNSKNGIHQFGPDCNFNQYFSSLAFKREAVGAAKMFVYAGGGT